MSETRMGENPLADIGSFRQLISQLQRAEETAHLKRMHPKDIMGGESMEYFSAVDQLYRRLGYSTPSEWYLASDLQERIENLDAGDISSLSEDIDRLAIAARRPVPGTADGDVIGAMNNKLTSLKGYVDLRKSRMK